MKNILDAISKVLETGIQQIKEIANADLSMIDAGLIVLAMGAAISIIGKFIRKR